MNKPKIRFCNLGHGRTGGFTLIELMIATAIVVILGAIAYPSYQAHLIKSRRASAQAFLMNIAQVQQQYLLDARTYAADTATLKLSTPAEVGSYYTISVVSSSGPPPAFTATAAPISGSKQAVDGSLTINEQNVKTSLNKSW